MNQLISAASSTTTSTTSSTTSTTSVRTTTTFPVSSSDGWVMCPAFPAKIAANDPEPPRSCLKTFMPPVTGRTLSVAAGNAADLQAKINAAVAGDEIVLPAGSTFTGNFTLPNKSGVSSIIIRTSDLAGLPKERYRVNPAVHARAMARILTPNTSPAIQTQYSAHDYRLIGLEIGVASGVGATSKSPHEVVANIVLFGDVTETDPLQLAQNIVIDRCYIHGNAGANSRRGIGLNASNVAVVDSQISEIHEIGQDSQAIGGWSGQGPYKIVNNRLEASGENFLLGGSDPSIRNMVAADIEFRQNYLTKPLSWKEGDPSYAGDRWQIKNSFELKSARRVWVDGNVFENSWVAAQDGYLVLFTPRNQGGSCTACAVQDVTFTHNLVRNGSGGFQLLGTDNDNPSFPTQRVVIANNLVESIGTAPWGGQGWVFRVLAKALDSVTIDHNTFLQTSTLLEVGNHNSDGTYDKSTNFVFRNNLAPHNDYGVMGDNLSPGASTITTFFPGSTFAKNVLVRTVPGMPAVSAYPQASLFPTVSGAAFVFTDGWSQVGLMDQSGGDYRVSGSSAFARFGTDGKAVGADIDAINALSAKALNGQ